MADTPFKKAHDAYVESEKFNGLSDPTTLKAPADQRQYLENRLWSAFSAGWRARGDTDHDGQERD